MPLLKKEFKEDILYISLNDPGSQNAFSPQMALEFQEAIGKPSFSGLIVDACGSQFCSGGNLRFYQKLENPEEGLAHNSQISEILDQLYNLSVPTVAVVNGGCFGGGVELLSCFDWVVATPKSLFGLWQRRIGLTFGWGGQERLEEKIGSSQCLQWLLSAETLTSWQALNLGLVNQVSLSSQSVLEAREETQKRIKLGIDSFAKIKENRINQPEAFKQLWAKEWHLRALKKFK